MFGNVYKIELLWDDLIKYQLLKLKYVHECSFL